MHLPILTIQQCLDTSSYLQNTLWKATLQHKALCGRHKQNHYLLSFDTSSFIKKGRLYWSVDISRFIRRLNVLFKKIVVIHNDNSNNRSIIIAHKMKKWQAIALTFQDIRVDINFICSFECFPSRPCIDFQCKLNK